MKTYNTTQTVDSTKHNDIKVEIVYFHVGMYYTQAIFLRGNQKWTIKRNWQYREHKTKTNKAKSQYSMCWTPLYVNKHTNKVNKT